MAAWRLLLALPLAAAIAGCSLGNLARDETAAAAATGGPAAGATGRVVTAPLVIAGRSYAAQWYLPAGAPRGFVEVQHGFSRHCQNLLETTLRLVDEGLMALCIDADMSAGNPALADALAAALVAGLVAPDGRPVPDAIVVGGHSAGGHFAARLGRALAQLAPQRLRGAVLFDPVAADAGFVADLQVLSAAGLRPVRVVSANPGACNAQNNAYPALRQLRAEALAAGRDGFVGLQLSDRSTHVDAEGPNTDFIGWVACGQGKPQAGNAASLRALAAAWALDLALGTRTAGDYPGGSAVDALLASGKAQLID